MKKSMKSHKGMTLYEMIISIAIFAIMCLILVGVGMHIDRVHQATNDLKKKVATEAPIAANKRIKDNFDNDIFDPATDVTDMQITIRMDDGDPKDFYVPGDNNLHHGTPVEVLDAQKYNTERVYNAEKNQSALSDAENAPISADQAAATINGQLNLEFINILTTAPVTSSTTTTTTTTTTTP